MQTKRITIEIKITQIEGHRMPTKTRLLDKLIDHLYDFTIDDSAFADTVHITHINGISTAEG